MRRQSQPLLLVAAVFAVAWATGCDRETRLRTYPVSGTVLYQDSERFAGGNQSFIVFESIENNINATGVIEADGTFSLGTYEPNDGAVAGRHRVSITPPAPAGDADQTRATLPIHAKYCNLDTSDLQVSVEAIRSNHISITVTRAQ